MSATITANTVTTDSHLPDKSIASLLLGAIGVVYGDIGTSPLYALKESFAGEHAPALNHASIFGILSLMFWSVMLVVSLKYVIFIMRADNHGEGGILALFALTHRLTGDQGKLARFSLLAGVFGAALFYGDGIITPAISVLSAVEGLEVLAPALASYILPIALAVLLLLFVIQRQGTERIGKFFGPIMCLWFSVLGLLGIINILKNPAILGAIDPHHAWEFFLRDPYHSFLSLGAVVLTLTGAEALYADMGHFGREPIRIAWFAFIAPALLLNYFGQGALLTIQPAAAQNPFYLLAPGWALLPLVLLATLATVIASQAVISGAFSLTKQAIQLGLLPRMNIRHTSAEEIGQIYVPFINWALLVGVVLLVLGFRTSGGLAAAYGIAVTGTMVVTTLLAGIVMRRGWGWSWLTAGSLLCLFLAVDLAFFGANLTKVMSGGWFPLALGITIFTILITWKRGKQLLAARMREIAPMRDQTLTERARNAIQVSGTAIYMTTNLDTVPNAFLHNLEHNKVLHERVIFLTLVTEDNPYVPDDERIAIYDLSSQFFRVVVHYGFMEDPDVPRALRMCAAYKLHIDPETSTFFLGREIAIPTVRPGMALWREHLFSWMGRNASSAMEFFRLPAARVMDIGSHLEI